MLTGPVKRTRRGARGAARRVANRCFVVAALLMWAALSPLWLTMISHDLTLWRLSKELARLPMPPGSVRISQFRLVAPNSGAGYSCFLVAGVVLHSRQPEHAIEQYFAPARPRVCVLRAASSPGDRDQPSLVPGSGAAIVLTTDLLDCYDTEFIRQIVHRVRSSPSGAGGGGDEYLVVRCVTGDEDGFDMRCW
jgi:hypothetical protein